MSARFLVCAIFLIPLENNVIGKLVSCHDGRKQEEIPILLLTTWLMRDNQDRHPFFASC